MTEGNEQRHKVVVFNEGNVIGARIDKFTSMLGKLSTQNRQSKPFKPGVYQGRGHAMINSGMGDEHYNDRIRNITRPSGTLEAGTILEMIEIEVDMIKVIKET